MAYYVDVDVQEAGGYEPSYRKGMGAYTFSVESTATETGQKIKAICHNADTGLSSSMAREFASGTQLTGWYVVANDTTADVYANIRVRGEGGGSGKPLAVGDYLGEYSVDESSGPAYSSEEDPRVFISDLTLASMSGFAVQFTWASTDGKWHGSGVMPSRKMGYNGVYFYATKLLGDIDVQKAYDCLYGYGDPRTELIARFTIDIGTAGGYPGGGGGSGGSDWTSPGDWRAGSTPSDPTYTLHLNVTGALSGRHNDHLNDTSYSYAPSDKDTVKAYGCGGDGGHGGGGGAGASTIVIQQFATDRAHSKDLTAIAKRHGYGSGGGKGGKGGDGCILIYY